MRMIQRAAIVGFTLAASITAASATTSTSPGAPFPLLPFLFFQQQAAATPVQTAPAQEEGQSEDVLPTRQVVYYGGVEAPGTIVIHTGERHLFLVLPGGKALRYGVGVGREGFQWSGVNKISMKQEWPDWRPPADMLQRRPELPRYMAGGIDNPLGARAMYLGNTLYRIHGSNEPETIGHAVSSGCIRMLNADVEDLYARVQIGTTVVVTR